MTPEQDPAGVPANITVRDGRWRVHWQEPGGLRFTHPFFRETLQTAGGTAHHETSLGKLGELAVARPGLPPAGFIFHLSRCGSTLVSQMLAALPRHIVLSEPRPVDALLWPCPEAPAASVRERAAWLRWVVSALGRQRHPEEERVFIKFDSWHTLDLPLIRRAFPGVPCLFLYRDPVEILVSHSLRRGTQMIPGLLDPARLGVDLPAFTTAGMERYAARVLACLAAAALDHLGPDARLVHYRDLPAAAWPGILRFFKVEVSPDESARMAAAAIRDAKAPARAFLPDTDFKQSRATPALRALADECTGALYARLEARRLAQPPL